MGEYWKPVNLTRREFIHPHHMDCGLKLGEWWEWNDKPVDSPVRRLMDQRWPAADDVRAVSDYGGQLRLRGDGDAPWPDYDTLEDEFTEVDGGSRESPEAAVPSKP